MQVQILRYIVVHDCGTGHQPDDPRRPDPGGVAQGIGNAFYEQLVFDDNGQLLNASFMDYLLPTALDVPRIEVATSKRPRPSTPRHQGCGRGGGDPGRRRCLPRPSRTRSAYPLAASKSPRYRSPRAAMGAYVRHPDPERR